MIFEQYYLECLSHASYLVGDETTGKAVIVDPQRDVGQYVRDAVSRGLKIERVLETHVHADFLSGHLELAELTGAIISYGSAVSGIGFPHETLSDGQRISLGEVELEIRETPGHTPESISIVVFEHGADTDPSLVLTGDTLFIGDVGRPDLLASVGFTADELARQLYHSLHKKLLTLPDATKVFPAHGAGSSCGKQLSTETQSTIGEQRKNNYALAPMSEDEFVEVVSEGQNRAPGYFSFAASRNREARPVLDEMNSPPAHSVADLTQWQLEGVIVLDTRDPMDFARGHIKGSINVDLAGRFAEWVGSIISAGSDIELVCVPGTEIEATVRLARIGFDSVKGYLDKPLTVMAENSDLVERSSRLTASEFNDRKNKLPNLQIIDVRNSGEVTLGSIPGAKNIPLTQLVGSLNELDPALPIVTYCAGGARSAIAASVLREKGFTDVSDLLGGYGAWSKATTVSS